MTENSTLHNAKTLRSSMTDAENRLWYYLRAHRFMGLKFKRQKPIGCYIVDFICQEHRLIVEVDGGQHAEQVSYDRHRDNWLRKQGYVILRFWNKEVMQQTAEVLEKIRSEITLSPIPSDGTTSHSTRLANYVSQVAGYPTGGRGEPRSAPSPFGGRGASNSAASPTPVSEVSRIQHHQQHVTLP